MKTVLSAAFFALAMPGGAALAQQQASPLSGTWVILWPNNTRNDVKLDQSEGRASGSYKNDDGEPCPITGHFRASDRALSLQIVCPKWDARMQGALDRSGGKIEGSYQAYVDSTGRFSMTRK